MKRRFFIAALTASFAPLPAIAQQDIDQVKLTALLDEIRAKYPKRFAELGARTGETFRRSRAVYVVFEHGRVRLLQNRDGTLEISSKVLQLDSDPTDEELRRLNDDDDAPSSGGPPAGGPGGGTEIIS